MKQITFKDLVNRINNAIDFSDFPAKFYIDGDFHYLISDDEIYLINRYSKEIQNVWSFEEFKRHIRKESLIRRGYTRQDLVIAMGEQFINNVECYCKTHDRQLYKYWIEFVDVMYDETYHNNITDAIEALDLDDELKSCIIDSCES